MFRLGLGWLQYVIHHHPYKRVLDTLGDALAASIGRIDEANETGPPDYGEYVMEHEVEIIEHLLGNAYVTCQSAVTAVVQAALRFRREMLKENGSFEAFEKQDFELRALGERFNDDYSKLEVLWQLGNYFKHQDEWSWSTWDKPKGLAHHTILALKAAGLSPGSTGNLRTGAETLGMAEYSQTLVLHEIVRAWAEEVWELCLREKARGERRA